MSIKPKVHGNIALNANEDGCDHNVLKQIKTIKKKEPLTNKPLNVLIIGGSSGYGLASRIALAFGANAYTLNVSFENPPTKRRTGSAGYYNNESFVKYADQDNIDHDDINDDAFSFETKENVIQTLKDKNKKIDLILYSLASGVRIDPFTKEKFVSTLKPTEKPYQGLSVNIQKESITQKSLEPATQKEIDDTVKVMGGEDYLLWVQELMKEDLFNEQAKALTYTYIGSPITHPIYKDGTIGKAKKHLEKTAQDVQNLLDKVNGKSYVSSSKTVITKASVFIPTVPLYASALFKVMKEKGSHESIIDHKYRLFKDYIFNPDNNETFVRLDHHELNNDTQEKVKNLLNQVQKDSDLDKIDFDYFKKEFMNLNGFTD